MQENSITQIRIKGNLVGVAGLQVVMESMAPDFAAESDAAIGEEMIRRLSVRNYIPGSVRDHYSGALVREFKKFLGQPVEEERPTGLEVLILGPGCAQCNHLEEDVRNVMAEMNLAGEMIHVTDVREIGKYGVMGVPALIINRKVVAAGSVPEKKKIRQWFKDATENSGVK